MRFGDRQFYSAWWNAKDISEYWRYWYLNSDFMFRNNPVYNWGKRHIYLALTLKHGVSRDIATLVVFLISAILHELLIGIPTKNLNGLAFWVG